MLKLVFLFSLFVIVYCHRNSIQNEADLQTSLMPQELNPEFVPHKDDPWQAVIPLPRSRRNVEELQSVSLPHQIKWYSRIVACTVLAVSALTEIILYIVESIYAT